jgi:L-malate glycosyltransferase
MKICYISGNAPRIFKLMEDMVNRGHDVYWVALNPPKYRIKGVKIFEEIAIDKESVLFKYFAGLHKFILFKKILNEVSPDILHAINVRKAGWFTVLSGFKPTIVSTQGGDIMPNERTYTHRSSILLWVRKNFIRNWLRKYTLRKATVVTYGNNTMLTAIQKYAKPKQGFLYFSGVNFDSLKPLTDSDELKKRLGIARKKIVFSPRMFNSNSNIDIIIKTIPIVKERIPEINYLFACHAGVSNYRNKIAKIIRDLGVEDYCTIVDEIPPSHIHEYYSISDVVVSVVSSDGMPSTVLEAMAYKRAIVLSDIPVYNELFSDFTYSARIRNEIDTANAIIDSFIDKPKTLTYTENAFKWVLKNADSSVLNNDLEKLYNDLLIKTMQN